MKKTQDRGDTGQCTLHGAQLVLDLPAPIVEAKWRIGEQQIEPVSPAHLNVPMTQAMPWHNVPPIKRSINIQIIHSYYGFGSKMNKEPYLQMDYKLKYFRIYLERCGGKLFSGIFFACGGGGGKN